jgi:signal peptidase I
MSGVILPVAVAIALAFAVQAAVAKPYEIPTGSMKPTIAEGDRIIANRVIYRLREVERGDIIVFTTTQGIRDACSVPADTPFVKRVIGLPGDEIEVSGGRTLVNGQPYDVPNAAQPRYEGFYMPVPENSLFVLGDNRNESCDSHSWPVPFISQDRIIGQAEISYWPPRSLGFLD